MGDMADYYSPQESGWATLFARPSKKKQPLNKIISCKHCKKSGLSWKQHNSGKWWLAEDNGDWHTCK